MNLFQNNKTLRPFSLSILICLLAVVISDAQTQKFQKVYGGYSYDYGNDLIQTPDTGYLLLCTSNSFSGSSDIYLLKVDKLGAYEWQHTYGGNEIEGACKIKITQDGNIAMAGHTSSFTYNSYDFYLIKANMNGDTIWTKHYGTSEWDFANSMDTCADGGFILAGKTYDTGNAYSDILIVKTDADGNEQWQKKLGGMKDDMANSIITQNDGYIICGTTQSNGAGLKDIYVSKIDLFGNLIWERTFGDVLDDEGADVFESSDGIIVVSGRFTFPTFPNNFNTFIYKIRPNGLDYWASQNSSIGTINYRINGAIEGYNKGITSIGGFNPTIPNSNDVFIFINDSTANYVESGTFGGSFDDYGKSIIKTSDFGYAAIGTTNSFGMGLSNIYFIKTDTVSPSTGTFANYVSLQETKQLNVEQNQVYPNPFNQSSTVYIDFPVSVIASQAFALKLYDQLGNDVSNQIAYTVKEINKGTSLNITNLNLSNGMYFYGLTINQKVIAQGKFTIIK